MIVSWMTYGFVISLFVLLGAVAADGAARIARRPVRWVWASAMALTLALVLLAPLRRTAPLTVTVTGTAVAAAPVVVRYGPSLAERATLAVAIARQWVDDAMRRAAQYGSRHARGVEQATLAGWMLASLALVGVFGAAQLRIRRARRRWPVAELHGTRVRVAPDAGPVVIGFTRPEIVVPQWLLGRPPVEQRLVIAHEAAHARALDTLLLTGGCAAVVLAPWCVALWYMLSRLRLAVELDCDARVLREGAAPRSYGSLLIDVAEQCAGTRFGAPALTAGPSHLERRLIAMQQITPRFARTRGAASVALCTLALLAACEAKMPTSADVDALDASKAEAQAKQLGMLRTGDTAVFVVDGKVVSGVAAKRMLQDSIMSVRVSKGAGRLVGDTIEIRTKVASADGAMLDDVKRIRRRSGDSTDSLKPLMKVQVDGKHDPILFIDGVRVPNTTMASLDPKTIESVEVIKGTAVAAKYPGVAGAEYGVIEIRTKK